MRRLWLTFAQAVTVCIAVLFTLKTLKPEWLTGWPTLVAVSSIPSPAISITEAPANHARGTDSSGSYANAAQKAVPAVVHIYTSQTIKVPRHPLENDPVFRHFFGDRLGESAQRRSGLGSGVVVSPEGYILTNFHVINGADEIEVASNDGQKYKAKVVGSDPESDLAVLRVPADHKLPVITFGNSDRLRVGDIVLAIGNPFGVGQTVTSGIVSALGRSHLGINTFENFIQTDAAINPGNSGGALVDTNGNLVGINTAIYSESGGSMGIGFAIPVSLAKTIMEAIIKNGAVTRGWIGVEVQEITPELAESFKLPTADGALIAGVVRNAPAEKAGIQPGDVLLDIAGKPVKDAQAMLSLIATLEPGKVSRLKLMRAGKVFYADVNISKRPPPRTQE
ncbi:MAG: Do family serine endopeptidase [Rugosibacter sp.]|jgi:Do/DeqQ family serine protease|nr:serine protease DegQ [Rugosibacter sp.]